MPDFELLKNEADLRMARLDLQMNTTLKNAATFLMVLVVGACALNLAAAVSCALHLLWGRFALNLVLAGINGALSYLWFTERSKLKNKIATEEQRIDRLQKRISERLAILLKAA